MDIADYDLDTALVMLEGKRFLYVGFMCHQVVEKSLKACCAAQSDEMPPYTHNLSQLAKKTNLYQLFSDQQKDLLDLLEPLNVEARYPTHKEKISKSLSAEKC